MTEFEYLAVLVSIIIGLGLTHVLTGAARLIQRRDVVRWYAPTMIWLPLTFLMLIQIWWSAYESRNDVHWQFFDFLSFLLIPMLAFLLSYLLVPDFERDDVPDLRGTFHRNRPWFFGMLAFVCVVSLARDLIDDGLEMLGSDAAFRVVFLGLALLSARARGDRGQLVLSIASAATFTAYVVMLFRYLE